MKFISPYCFSPHTEDPVAITEPCCPNSLTKFLLDVFAGRSTSGLFYTTDMMVLIDIVTRQLSDLGPGEEVSKVEGGGKEMEEGEGSRLLVWNVFREVLSPFSPCPPPSLFPLSPLPLSCPLSPSCLLFPLPSPFLPSLPSPDTHPLSRASLPHCEQHRLPRPQTSPEGH